MVKLFRAIALGSCVTALSLWSSLLVQVPATAQSAPDAEEVTAPPEEFRVGQVDPDRPIRIEITNGSDEAVLFEMTQPVSAQRELPPFGEIAFGTTHTSFLPPPVYLLAYPSEPEIGVNLYVTSIEDNVIEMVVSEQLSDIPGDRILEILADGSVYAR